MKPRSFRLENTEPKPASRGAKLVASMLVGMLGVFFLVMTATLELLPAIEASRAQLAEVPATLRDAQLDSLRGGRGPTVHSVETHYTYTYNGTTFQGSRVGFGWTRWWFYRKTSAEDLLHEIKSRRPFVVYVDTRSPASSVIMDDTTGILGVESALLVLIGVVNLGIGGWGVRRALRESPTPSTA